MVSEVPVFLPYPPGPCRPVCVIAGREEQVGRAEAFGVLGEVARTVVTAFPIQSILDRPAESIGRVLPISAAGATVIPPGVMRRDGAASDAYAGCFAELRTELGGCCFKRL